MIGLYKSDAGSYICIADNGIGQPDEKEYKLTVTGKFAQSQYGSATFLFYFIRYLDTYSMQKL